MSEAESHALRELAERMGIVPGYLDQTQSQWRVTSDETRRDLLGAMGLNVSSERAIHDSLNAVREEETADGVAAVTVIEHGQRLELDRLLRTAAASGSWQVALTLEQGDRQVVSGVGADAPAELAAPPLGYHQLALTRTVGGHEQTAEQLVIVVPPRCVSPEALLGRSNAFGLTANLYTLRSAQNWGIGDFTDLSALAEWAASNGAEFVGVNPLHALLNRGTDVSPYSPVSRLFRNPIYIDVARVPELQEMPELRERLESPELCAELEALRESTAVKYQQVMGVKAIVLDALHKRFAESVLGGETPRARAYQEYVNANEPALGRFAQWMAIAEREGANWQTWPGELRRHDSRAVLNFADSHAARIDYHRWLQFETDRQLGESALRARASGMRVGLYQDLAIGTCSWGADTWAFPDLFVRGVSIGAPPDPYSATGQNWGLPPIDPRMLRRTCYHYFIDLVRGAFRHTGALRVDHVMGLFRLFWIPDGKSGSDGAYVRYPSNDLLGILALESVRNNALVVGEDLGTVPEEVPPALEKWGILSSKVMYFERDHRGYKPAHTYPRLSLATADTHDMASIAGFWQERDVEIRRDVGLIDEDEACREREQRATDRQALLSLLSQEKVLPNDREPTSAELRGAVHAFLCRTPAALVGLALDDLAGETEPVNVPGVGPEKFASWTRKMRDPLEVIAMREETHIALRCDGRRGVRGG
jgi:4-alpha-glucanotransferase